MVKKSMIIKGEDEFGSEIMCFVIMPFSQTSPKHTEEYWTKHWKFLKKKIEECNRVKASRSEALRGDILRGIITDIYRADIVVADLTDRNPNVYWELGVRQSFKKGTITIAETKKHIPFDMLMKSILRYYPNDSIKNEEFVDQFKKAIINCIEFPEDSDSQVLETLGGRGTIYQIINKDESIRRIEALVQEVKVNINHLTQWLALIEDNKDKPRKEWRVPTIPLSHSACELLVVNRYIDEKDDFYDDAMLYLGYIKSCNTQLQMWRAGGMSDMDWFIKNLKGHIILIIYRFSESVMRVQQYIALR